MCAQRALVKAIVEVISQRVCKITDGDWANLGSCSLFNKVFMLTPTILTLYNVCLTMSDTHLKRMRMNEEIFDMFIFIPPMRPAAPVEALMPIFYKIESTVKHNSHKLDETLFDKAH